MSVDSLNWQSKLDVPGHVFPSGDLVTVTVGLVETTGGDLVAAHRVGDGPVVLLSFQDAAHLGLNVSAVLSERLRLTVDKLGDRAGETAEDTVDRGDGGDSSRS